MGTTKIYRPCNLCLGSGQHPNAGGIVAGREVPLECEMCEGTGRGKIVKLRATDDAILRVYLGQILELAEDSKKFLSEISRFLQPQPPVLTGPDAPAPPWVKYAWAIMGDEDGALFAGAARDGGPAWTTDILQTVRFSTVEAAASMVEKLGNARNYALVRVPMSAAEYSLL